MYRCNSVCTTVLRSICGDIHASVLRHASQVGPMHKATGMGKLVNAARRHDLHWLDVPDRVKYRLCVTVYKLQVLTWNGTTVLV